MADDEDFMSLSDGNGGMTDKVRMNLEGIVPVLIVLVIGFFIAGWLGILGQIPILGPALEPISDSVFGTSQPMKMLVLGQLTQEEWRALNTEETSRIVNYQVIRASEVFQQPEAYLKNFDLIYINQTTTTSLRELPATLAEALKDYVQRGGKMIIVQNSAIRVDGQPESFGWASVFGSKFSPVACDQFDDASCRQAFNINGKLFPVGVTHPILEGITEAPAADLPPITFSVYKVNEVQPKIAYIKDDLTGRSFVGIVEKKSSLGQPSILYFNYNPGLLPGIMHRSLKYMKEGKVN